MFEDCYFCKGLFIYLIILEGVEGRRGGVGQYITFYQGTVGSLYPTLIREDRIKLLTVIYFNVIQIY